MKSNYLKSIEPEPVKEEVKEVVEEEKEEEKEELTLEEKEEIKVKQIQAAMQRAAKAQQCHFNLTAPSIYDIF